MEIVKIGSVELTREEAAQLYDEQKYIVAWNKIWSIKFSQVQNRYYGQCVYTLSKKGEHFTRRGRFYRYSAEDVNWLLGFKFLN